MNTRIGILGVLALGTSLSLTIGLTGCGETKSPEQITADSLALDFPQVHAMAQTTMVASSDDAADDPCVWIHPDDKSKSLIIGTNKRSGIDIYNLQGEMQASYPVGRVNNVDVRYGFQLGDKRVDIVVATNRSHNGLSVFVVNSNEQTLTSLGDDLFPSAVGEVYGFALGQPKMQDKLYAVLVSKTGQLEQWELNGKSGSIAGKIVRAHQFSSICEGIVVDDFTGVIYVGQEEEGIWKLPLDPKSNKPPEQVFALSNSPGLISDIEGISIYYASETEGYIIASIQGNNSYAVLEREEPHTYLGSFTIQKGLAIDGVQETDGVDVVNRALPGYPYGFLIVQDGHNHMGGKLVNQNFKIVDWKSIAFTFSPALKVASEFEQ